MSDPSPWLHLRVGQLLTQGGRFGLPDPLSASAGQAYQPTQWLPSMAAYELVARFGVPAIAWLRALALVGLFVTLCLTTRRRLGTVAAVTAAAGVTLVCLPTMTERPQSLGMVLLALSVLGWWQSLDDGCPRWWLVPLAWLFGCSHGLWLLGLLAGLVVCVGRVLDGAQLRKTARLARVLVLQVVVTALTPLGPALLVTPFTTGANGRAFVQEWQPGSLASVTVLAVIALVGVVVVVTLARHECLARSRVLVVAIALALTAASVRTGGPGVVLLTPVLAEVLASRAGRPTRRLPVWPLLPAAVLAAVVAVPLSLARAELPQGVPTGLSSAIAALPAGTVLLSQAEVSGWVLWTAPQIRLVADIRVEAYTARQMNDFVTLYQARPGWLGLLDRSGASYALVPGDAPLVGALEHVRHWTVVGGDTGFVLLAEPAR
ncbi:MAG: hypothetical protein M3Y71_15985 [Actinomycetota bacterium]|nr:hypothetical protein [Actinomycetota bacterium]